MCTDGAPSMRGKEKGLIGPVKKREDIPNFTSFYCIIHQEALVSKLGNNGFLDVMQTVVRVIQTSSTFLTDITSHMNAVNLQLQGRDKLPSKMLNAIRAFQNKITALYIPDREFTHSLQMTHPCSSISATEDLLMFWRS